MFAGIIESMGTVLGVQASPRPRVGGALAHRLDVELGDLAEGLPLGASVAVNGACLTLAELGGTAGRFDVVPETWKRTTLCELKRNDRVNLERSLRVGDRVDGHFVQGHVDGVGSVERLERGQGEWKLWIECEAEPLTRIIPKCSVALDGTSLTVVDVGRGRFSVALIPTTLERTTLQARQPGDHVNIETDILARLVLARLHALTGAASQGSGDLTWEKLRDGGFVS